ncbi:hypothetical protein EVAR_103733_1, partial [Eumeta japonica]
GEIRFKTTPVSKSRVRLDLKTTPVSKSRVRLDLKTTPVSKSRVRLDLKTTPVSKSRVRLDLKTTLMSKSRSHAWTKLTAAQKWADLNDDILVTENGFEIAASAVMIRPVTTYGIKKLLFIAFSRGKQACKSPEWVVIADYERSQPKDSQVGDQPLMGSRVMDGELGY